MIFQLLKQLQTDVWFCFDGFYYGCACIIDECTKDSLYLGLKPEEKRMMNKLFTHLPKILKESTRMHTELKIYFPPKFAKELNTSRKLLLFTETSPEIIKNQLNDLQMKFINLKGLSTKHSDNWKNIISYEFGTGVNNF